MRACDYKNYMQNTDVSIIEGKYYFDGSCINVFKNNIYPQGNTFSVGIFQMIPKKSGELKRGKVIKRIKGYSSEAEKVFLAAQSYCDKFNK